MILGLVEKIKLHCKALPEQADFVFTTTHKAKGLEWKTVVLLDDFIQLDTNQRTHDMSADEINLLYVALTRACENVVLNRNLVYLLALGGESFEDVISMKQAKLLESTIECAKCHANIASDDNVLGLKSRFVKMRSGTVTVEAGHICSVCAAAVCRLPWLYAMAVMNKRVKSREFLRYIVGVLPAKFKEALAVRTAVDDSDDDEIWNFPQFDDEDDNEIPMEIHAI